MTTITKFDRALCRQLGEEVAQAVAEIAERYGLTAQYAGGTFGETEFTAKVKLIVTDPEIIERKQQSDFATWCGFFGLKPEEYGLEFTNRGERYKLIGIIPSRSKMPIKVIRLSDNSERVFGTGIIPAIRGQQALEV